MKLKEMIWYESFIWNKIIKKSEERQFSECCTYRQLAEWHFCWLPPPQYSWQRTSTPQHPVPFCCSSFWEKQRTSRQQNPMRFVINWWCSDGFTILKPFYCRFGPTLGLAIQRNWFVFRHDYVGGVFGDAGWTVLSWK